MKEVTGKGNQINKGDREYKLFKLDTIKYEILDEIKSVEYNDLEDMGLRMDLTNSEIEYTLGVKDIDTKSIGYTLPPGIYGITDFNLMLKSFLPLELKKNISVDDNRLKSKLTTK